MTTPPEESYLEKRRRQGREQYQLRAAEIKARKKEWVKNHSDSVKETQRRYRETNKEKIDVQQAIYRKNNPHRHRALRNRWMIEKPEVLARRDRNQKLKSAYGITAESWDRLFSQQGKCCAICRRSEIPGKKVWHTDHDHITGQVRGILCHNCNTMLGGSRDIPDTLRAAIAYLAAHA